MGAVQIRIIVPTEGKAGRKTSELMLGQDMVQKNARQELITITQEGIEMTKTIEQLTARVALISQERNGYMEAADRACDERDEFKAKVAELEAENAKLHEQVDLQVPKMAFAQLKEQLAAEQLNNKLLREALEFLNARIVTMDLGGVVERALSTPASTEALDKYVAEKVREARK